MPPFSPQTSIAVLMRQVRHLISRRKGVRLHHLRPITDLLLEFGFEAPDMVDLILAVESYFHLTIPDEVPLRTPSDFMDSLRVAVCRHFDQPTGRSD